MKKIKLFTAFLLTIILSSQVICAQEKPHFLETNKKAKILLLGTFHFGNPGNDAFKPKYEINIFSKKRQKQVREILHLLKKYQPTKIAVEVNSKNQKSLDSLYQTYLNNTFQSKNSFISKSNEVYQLGFRLAKLLNQRRVYAVDAWSAPFIRKYILENEDDIRNAISHSDEMKWQNVITNFTVMKIQLR